MRKLIFPLIFLFFALLLAKQKVNFSAYASRACPAGVYFYYTSPAIALPPSGSGTGVNVCIPFSVADTLKSTNPVEFDYGEGTKNYLIRRGVCPGTSSVARFIGYYEYPEAKDYIPYAFLYPLVGSSYLCSFSTVDVYYKYTGWNLSNLSTSMPQNASTYTFNANSTFGGNNRIGYLNPGIVTAIQGTGGNNNSDYWEFDKINYYVTSSYNPNQVWGGLGYVVGDTNINDDNPNFSYGSYGYSDGIRPRPALYARTNLINITLRGSTNTYINGSTTQPNGNPWSGVYPPIVSDFDFVNTEVYWQPIVETSSSITGDDCPAPQEWCYDVCCNLGYVCDKQERECIPGPFTTPTPTPTPAANAWVFPSYVYDKDTGSGVSGAILNLYGSNDGSTYNPPSSLATCETQDWGTIGRCNPPLSTQTYRKWYFVKKTQNPSLYSSDSAACNPPFPPPIPLCETTDSDTIKWGGATGFVPGSYGYYSINNFYITQGFSSFGWFQVQGGDLYANGNITNPLPEGEKLNDEINDQASEGTSFYDGSLSLSQGEAGRNANSSAFYEMANYLDVKKWFTGATFNDLSSEDLTASSLDQGEGSLGNTVVYLKEGNATVSDFDNFSGNVVIFVNGNLTIEEDITVDELSFLGFIVSGNISVDSDVKEVEGFYFTDGTFSTGDADKQVTFSGTFVADNGFNLDRNLGEAQNPNKPSEIFEYRPDFSLSAPAELRRPYRYYFETAP